MSLTTYKQVTEQAAEELRRAAERFEQITAEADAQIRKVLERWEREMEDRKMRGDDWLMLIAVILGTTSSE